MKSDLPLDRLGIRNFRSIDDEGIYFQNFSKINLFIGKNNSGKSNVLKFLKLLGDNVKDFSKFPATLENQHNRNKSHPSLFFYNTHEELKLPEKVAIVYAGYHRGTDDLKKILTNPLKFNYSLKDEASNSAREFLSESLIDTKEVLYEGNSLVRNILQSLNVSEGRFSGWEAFYQHFINITANNIKRFSSKIIYVPEFRIIKEGNNLQNSNSSINGANIISEMYKMQSPDIGEEGSREMFWKITETAKEMLGVESLKIEIPHTKDKMIVVVDNKRLPLEFFGAGLNEIILLCSALLLHPEHIVCLEEPELHLHPELQRKFLKFLGSTNNQYFITTHSNIFLDYANEDLSIYHFKNDGSKTTVTHSLTDTHSKDIIEDLGYKHSDLLQANGIIWVEGPSDRTYIRKWISLLQPQLKEGINYSIMFYGGKLLSHLSCNFEFLNEEFIYLLRINRNAFVVMDKDGVTDKINATKERISKEIGVNSYWVTKGKEIENYLTVRTVNEWLLSKGLNPLENTEIEKNDKFDDAIKKVNPVIQYGKNKSSFSKELAEFIKNEDLERMDLSKKINQIVIAIQSWNK